jgi:hypothetical protein
MTWVLLILAGLFCVCVLIALDRIGNRLLRITELLQKLTESKHEVPSSALSRRWEYRLVTPHWRTDRSCFVYHVNEDIDEELTEAMAGRDTYMVMDELGQEGWELVDLFFLDLPPGGTHITSWNFIFKRPLRRYDVTR